MCVGNLFKPPKPPAAPKRLDPAPPLRPAPPLQEMGKAEKLREESEEEKISTRKKKALEIEKVKEGVKEFSAIDPATTPDSPPGGISGP